MIREWFLGWIAKIGWLPFGLSNWAHWRLAAICQKRWVKSLVSRGTTEVPK